MSDTTLNTVQTESKTNLVELIDFRILKKEPDGSIKENIFGINVFKVKEIITKPDLFFRVPSSIDYLEGMINLRERAVPILNLPKKLGFYDKNMICDYIIITEFNNITCGFMVHDIKKILKFAWSKILPPPPEIQNEYKNLVTGISLLKNKEIMLILDLETIIAETDSSFYLKNLPPVEPELIIQNTSKTALVVDDSNVARKTVHKILESNGYIIQEALNGAEALQKIENIVQQAKTTGENIKKILSVVVCDIEMPVMDGLTLTKTLKQNPDYSKIPIVLHTSLSGTTIEHQSDVAGADDFLVKFNPEALLKMVNLHT